MTEALTLHALIGRASAVTIESLYESLEYDYAKSIAFDTAGDDLARDCVLRVFAWKKAPTGEDVRRLFNQINSFYAERWLGEHTLTRPLTVLQELNQLLLFRQGKHVGIRARRIDYGYRVHLDFMDPFRRLKWLTGARSGDVPGLLEQWSNAVENSIPRRSSALALAMCLIAVHPFADANGRLARLVYTWLCERWHLRGDNWLGEDGSGELLRTGHGISSTEYLMAQFMIAVGDGANVLDPGSGGTRSVSDDVRMGDAIRRHLLSIDDENDGIVVMPAFTNLLSHLETDGHLRATSPRFECLRSLLQ
jgi:hypothetical protein